jgi:hypothetical protein
MFVKQMFVKQMFVKQMLVKQMLVKQMLVKQMFVKYAHEMNVNSEKITFETKFCEINVFKTYVCKTNV